MKKTLPLALLITLSSNILARELTPSNTFNVCQIGERLGKGEVLDKVVKISTHKSFRGCPKELIFNNSRIYDLYLVSSGVTGGEYSKNYSDISGFVSCSYSSDGKSLGCDLDDSLATNENLDEATVKNIEEAKRAWEARNK